ncbi:MAG TPA: chromosome segregation protein SMC [Casimicrobiaceae bacterium]|nr:chromosome segregation protein SMC [Casimicrobiaceae bacterium]
MRLREIKLAGFKSFVDPTAIGIPGQLVGIVGPNGCGKSNVIDAVRWVLGESKASALRGESMHDVIFNGAGDRKPVGRASVELRFDNSAGRIGGQWGQYAEIALKRVLSRDGDSSYYINNIPVRRRDIHDLFLGTGLGPRAYAIIEQGMISRVVEAKPDELRVFLEEAAGVSKYKERRKETEGRLSDSRENLSRVEDIRIELGSQLEKLEHQARVATEYREHEARLKASQHLLWFSKQQDALRSRERVAAEIATLTVALESLQADVRAAEAKIEKLRADHYAAGDALHERQGGFYAANSEVTRLEQQLAFARDSESRIGAQAAQISEQIGALQAQSAALDADSATHEAALEQALANRERALEEEQAARLAQPALDDALTKAAHDFGELAQAINELEQSVRIAETRRESAARAITQLDARRTLLEGEIASLAAPASNAIATVEEQLALETGELSGREAALTALQSTLQELQERQRATSQAWQSEARRLADLEAREQALSALQARVGHGKDKEAWLAKVNLADAPQLWRALDVDPGWNDALEAVLRERLEALELPSLADATRWAQGSDAPPVRIALFTGAPSQQASSVSDDALLAKVAIKRAEVARVIVDALHGVRCRDSIEQALADRAKLRPGETFVTPAGHLVGAQSVTLFKPDGEVHGVLERQRELVTLVVAGVSARATVTSARAALDGIEAELASQQQAYHSESAALQSQQRRCHDLELELVELKQTAQAAEKRRAQLLADRDGLGRELGSERCQHESIGREIADHQSRLHDRFALRDSARHLSNEAEVEKERGRERVRAAERAVQEAQFAERSTRDRLADLAGRREALMTAIDQQQRALAQLASERQAIDWTPVEEALQRQLTTRGEAEGALAAARDSLESLGAELRAAEEGKLACEHRIDPARQKILDTQMKEQAAAMTAQQFADQLAEAGADVATLPDALKAFGSKSQLPGEIERLQQAIAELGAVNLAALEELDTARERKAYLDRQAADLTEAMTTLESAIRQIDRESRELLQQTFDIVNENFGKLFPALFGGGQARLVLTGEEILDSGVLVVAQPPGKRNTSIHLLSGGEKALTATSLVFALFQLNPAPFCLLDEVDAPLDDSNTERFCSMVRDMSKETQFLFISHNKITMEMAGQLVGITMPEPGISRVVAVDIAEAVELAGAKAPAHLAA